MKKIVIVTDFQGQVGNEIERNLREVFNEKIFIEKVYVNKYEEGQQVQGDVLLFMLPSRVEQIQNALSPDANIVIVARTIREEEAFKIFEIPDGSTVLVVNDCYENTLQTISLLYKLRIRNLKLLPYDNTRNFSDITIAITPGESSRVPKHIKKIIDIGNRCLDSATMINIVNILGINDRYTNKRLLKYINRTANLEEGIKDQYRQLIIRQEQLNTIITISHEGVLLISEKGLVLLHNEQVEHYLEKPIIDGETQFQNLLEGTALENQMDFMDELIEINGKSFLVTKELVSHISNIEEYVVVFRDVTYIKQLEHSIWVKSESKGQRAKYNFDDIICKSKVMKQCLKKAIRFAANDLTVLIEGENGTGKELIAQSIHNHSARKHGPFIAINCAALPESLLESELFGYEKGAFTGARKEGKQGLFEQACGGSIFLDEIGDMPFSLQSRLLRVIQEKQIMRIGSNRVIEIDVRIISATNKNLFDSVKNRQFREDLYYRINVLPITVPPLRERKEDILLLFNTFLKEPSYVMPFHLRQILLDHRWDGNVRELKNIADYFKLMRETEEPYPPYLLAHSNSCSENHSKEFLEMTILRLCYESERHGISLGRQKLRDQIKQEGTFDVSEYQIRKQLEQIVKKGLMTIQKGRVGCRLTDEGRHIVKNLVNSNIN
ncbi:MAG: sigma 54-interacting transcriptional regulator [Marinisporobacter sp.]|jgi:transcriptional regulator with PAS, ATPase and Fis domain|nr:sigma 54-interacting transcriptional regulator [Marinisporobacter sp.]